MATWQTLHSRISSLAQEIWERKGRPDHSELECWLTAERELLGPIREIERILAGEIEIALPKLPRDPVCRYGAAASVRSEPQL